MIQSITELNLGGKNWQATVNGFKIEKVKIAGGNKSKRQQLAIEIIIYKLFVDFCMFVFFCLL